MCREACKQHDDRPPVPVPAAPATARGAGRSPPGQSPPCAARAMMRTSAGEGPTGQAPPAPHQPGKRRGGKAKFFSLPAPAPCVAFVSPLFSPLASRRIRRRDGDGIFFPRDFQAVANRRLVMGSADSCGCGRERGPAADVAADPKHDS